MSYAGTKTWAKGPWPFTDANLYIRDNFDSVRRYQNSRRAFVDAGITMTSAFPGTAQIIHTGILSSSPDENYEMQVYVGGIVTTLGTATNVSLQVKDEAGTDISPIAGGLTYATTTVGFGWSFCCVASKGSGVSGGYQIFVKSSAGTTTVVCVTSSVDYRPLV